MSGGSRVTPRWRGIYPSIWSPDPDSWCTTVDRARSRPTPTRRAELGPRQRPRHEVVLGVGPSGTGQCHICAAPGLTACGQGRRVRFVTVVDLVTELSEAQAEHGLSRLGQQLDRLDLLILDLPTPQLCRQGARRNRERISSRLLLVIGPSRMSA